MCILKLLEISVESCQVIVLAPYSHLVDYIVTLIKSLASYMNSVHINACVDGTTIEDLEGVHVVVGTPKHVYSMIGSGFKVDQVKLFVVDEADDLCSYFGCER